MSKVLIIGCGGVASVAIHKCCQVPEVFTEICIASRTKAKCDKLAAELAPTTTTKITTAQVDADHVDEVIALIKSYQPDLVMNIALPYQDLTIMDACLACGVNYMDTANYEPENTDDPEWRAIYEKRCKEAGFSAYFDYSWFRATRRSSPSGRAIVPRNCNPRTLPTTEVSSTTDAATRGFRVACRTCSVSAAEVATNQLRCGR